MSDTRQERILRVGEPLRLRPGATVSLADDFDPGDTVEVNGKKQGKKLLKTAVKVISDHQRRLAAQERDGVLSSSRPSTSVVRTARSATS